VSRPVFSFRPNLKNPEHEKAWRLLMEVPAGQRNQYLVDVILEKEEREMKCYNKVVTEVANKI
jgi:hypothetical protein